MKLIFGLGNPEKKYDGTRHNLGFWTLDTYAQQHGAQFKAQPKFHALVAETAIDGEKVLLVKPSTYYNEAGQSAHALMDYYKLSPQDLLVVHDELMVEFGKIRVRSSGSDAGNNGIKSLIAHLGTDQFARIRVGVGNALRAHASDADFVLGHFSQDEQQILTDKLLPQIVQYLEQFQRGSLEHHSVSIEP